MHPLRKKLCQVPLIMIISSVRWMVACLSILFILTFVGTIAQIDQGLYVVQERYFNSFVMTFWGFIPFPGARLILWILFFNLIGTCIVRMVYRWSNIGILLIHAGLFMFFISSFVTFHFAEESVLTLYEEEGSNLSNSYYDWELAIWKDDGAARHIYALDTKSLKPGESIAFKDLGLKINVQEYYANAKAYLLGTDNASTFINATGIKRLERAALVNKPEEHRAGIIFELEGPDQYKQSVLLFGGEDEATSLMVGATPYNFLLQHKRYTLPFTLVLKDFKMEKHPGIEVARKFTSLVEIVNGNTRREVLISMNEPLRHKDFTLYQASYAIDQAGREISTLAVVKNTGKFLPYVASFMTFGGMLIHLTMQALNSKKRRLKN